MKPHKHPSAESRSVQQTGPFAFDSDSKSFTIDVAEISPYVRVAHEMTGPLDIPERVIFDHELVLVLAGSGVLDIANSKIPYSEGDLLLIKPFTPHTFHYDSNPDSAHIAIHFDFCRDVPDRPSRPNTRGPYSVAIRRHQIPTVSPMQGKTHIRDWIRTVVGEWHASNDVAALKMSGLVSAVLSEIMSRQDVECAYDLPSDLPAVSRAKVLSAIGTIEREFAAPLSVTNLANSAGLSVGRFIGLFRAYTGDTPHHFLLTVRIAAARRMLARPELSIKEISAKCGFEDALNFSKAFRKIDGLTPSQFRETALIENIGPDQNA